MIPVFARGTNLCNDTATRNCLEQCVIGFVVRLDYFCDGRIGTLFQGTPHMGIT